ncbi:MAG: hypothetical protein LCH82_19185 [Actinobacteria bacterium]|nr:hypothetical protein [Actinomycetota bacterium]
MQRPNGTRHPDEVRGSITDLGDADTSQIARDWMSTGDAMTGAVVIFYLEPEKTVQYVVLGDDDATVAADTAAAQDNPLLTDATIRRRGDSDDRWPN